VSADERRQSNREIIPRNRRDFRAPSPRPRALGDFFKCEAVGRGELQRISQECNGIAIWCTAVAALERTYSGRADTRSFRQRFLGEAGGKPMTPKQITEGVRVGTFHGAILGRCRPQPLSALET